MLGGDEDDLDDLLRDCGNQIERPEMVEQSSARGESSNRVSTNRLDTPPGPSNISSTQLAQIIEQNAMLINLVAKQAKRPEDETPKRKAKEEVSLHAEEPTLLEIESYKIEDNAHDKVDTLLRQMLRPINVCPSIWWVKGAFKRVEKPILGSGLFLEQIMPSGVYKGTLCKHCDSWAVLEHKNYLSSNSGIVKEPKKRVTVKNIHAIQFDEFDMGIQTQWNEAKHVWEAMDGIFNFVAVEFMTRRYSHAGLSILRCLHEVRYFCGVAEGPKQQRILLIEFFNECLRKNQQRGREGKHRVTLTECTQIASKVLAANQISNLVNYYTGDPYLGTRADEITKKNNRIAELEKENKMLKSKLASYEQRSASYLH